MRDALDPVPPCQLPVPLLPPTTVVLPLVRVAAPGLRERLTAHAALVRLLPGVGELVFLEAGHLGEAF